MEDERYLVLNRLKRIEGQIKGIQKMVEEEKTCSDILMQVNAVRSAVNNVGTLILENHLKNCLNEAITHEEQDKLIKELSELISKYAK
ncbi:metal-sensitive transcriptional regulator [Natranaerofaba carboxydovora]|uniref:metal-sensitive transcriptional regulator n=1 Tax=Natranaerofaba carboxydovora TaxID=2742683 RepID=UPI001F12C561|nr:metal-sensitive transcriptional regulator [Natranaerofaba carboxydovora]UMZ73248.1 Copper-sensing transcriptional repressor CsoR [Natranaerofaba carboxydovora]